jgi:hypothetical protein
VLSTGNDPLLVTLAAGQNYTAADFGFTPGGLIGDRIWRDNNQDGLQGQYEPGIAGVTVELRDGICTPGANCPTAVTDSNGIYEFRGLPAGAYTVAIISGLPGGASQTYDPDATCPGGSCNGQTTLTLARPGRPHQRLRYYTPGDR